MPARAQSRYHEAAAKSAQVRSTRKLIRELSAVKPLTPTQRAEIIAAAASIPTVAAS